MKGESAGGDADMGDVVDLRGLGCTNSDIPKGFRRVEIEFDLEEEDDEDPFTNDQIDIDDLPDLECTPQQKVYEEI